MRSEGNAGPSGVITKKSQSLRTAMRPIRARTARVLLHRAPLNSNSQLQKFTAYPFQSPHSVGPRRGCGGRHRVRSDSTLRLFRAPRTPAPHESTFPATSWEDRLALHQVHGVSPARRESGRDDEQTALVSSHLRTHDCSRCNDQLPSAHGVLGKPLGSHPSRIAMDTADDTGRAACVPESGHRPVQQRADDVRTRVRRTANPPVRTELGRIFKSCGSQKPERSCRGGVSTRDKPDSLPTPAEGAELESLFWRKHP
jgi:hypothetical protein